MIRTFDLASLLDKQTRMDDFMKKARITADIDKYGYSFDELYDIIIESDNVNELQNFIMTNNANLNFHPNFTYPYPIQEAIAKSNNTGILKILFEFKADMNIVDRRGGNILHYLASRIKSPSYVIEFLVDLYNQRLYSFHHLLLQENIHGKIPLAISNNENTKLFLQKETIYYKDTLFQHLGQHITIKDIILLILSFCY